MMLHWGCIGGIPFDLGGRILSPWLTSGSPQNDEKFFQIPFDGILYNLCGLALGQQLATNDTISILIDKNGVTTAMRLDGWLENQSTVTDFVNQVAVVTGDVIVCRVSPNAAWANSSNGMMIACQYDITAEAES